MPPFIDMTGRRFGRLTVTHRAADEPVRRIVRWACRCDCGNLTEQRGSALRGGFVVSCGCVRTELATARLVAATRKADDQVGYTAAHSRVKRARGLASDYPCVDCGGAARDWSLRKGAGRPHVGGRDEGLLLSVDPSDYDPRCRSCHGKYDGWGHWKKSGT